MHIPYSVYALTIWSAVSFRFFFLNNLNMYDAIFNGEDIIGIVPLTVHLHNVKKLAFL